VKERPDWRGKVERKGKMMRSRRKARTSALVAPISAAFDLTAPTPSAALSVKAQPLQAAPSLAPNGAFVLTKSAATKIQLLEPPAGAQAPATDVNRSARSIRLSLSVIFFPSA
jgi:hypothetical protein